MELSLKQIETKTKGCILQGSPSLSFRKYNTDSRCSEPGELFFALIAERNGHAFIPEAKVKGAAGAVISQDVAPSGKDFALLKVGDTLEALQKLAADILAEHPVKIVGITGSIGKTTTKEFAASLLAPHFKVLKSEGNLNNHIGLPLSVLRLEKDHQVAMLEMGMNHAGEIRALTRIAPPEVALITNVQPVHLEFFSGMEGIASAKKEILEGTVPGGTAVLNGDDLWVERIAKDWEGEKILFGLSDQCDISARKIRMRGLDGMSFELFYGEKNQELSLPFFYETTLYNYLAAAALGYVFSLPLEDVCEQTRNLELYKMRGTIFHLEGDMTLIDDSYNSNPVGLQSSLKSVAALPYKRKVAVLGDMLELGEESSKYHKQAGEQVFLLGFDLLITVGTLSRIMAEAAIASGAPQDRVFSFAGTEDAAENIGPLLEDGDLILVKGSRGMKMEKIAARLKNLRRV